MQVPPWAQGGEHMAEIHNQDGFISRTTWHIISIFRKSQVSEDTILVFFLSTKRQIQMKSVSRSWVVVLWFHVLCWNLCCLTSRFLFLFFFSDPLFPSHLYSIRNIITQICVPVFLVCSLVPFLPVVFHLRLLPVIYWFCTLFVYHFWSTSIPDIQTRTREKKTLPSTVMFSALKTK